MISKMNKTIEGRKVETRSHTRNREFACCSSNDPITIAGTVTIAVRIRQTMKFKKYGSNELGMPKRI